MSTSLIPRSHRSFGLDHQLVVLKLDDPESHPVGVVDVEALTGLIGAPDESIGTRSIVATREGSCTGTIGIQRQGFVSAA